MAYKRRALTTTLSFLTYAGLAAAALPSTFPHQYPGQPTGDFSPAWQQYFQVTEKLPNVTFDLGRAFAGNIPVQRAGHPNDTLFFMGFEKSSGSLTAPASKSNNDPWGIWLNGGPGSSSLYGMLFENGPIHIESDYRASPNNHSWDKLADYFWVDQPVGVGYSTADSEGYIADEDQMGADFMGFLENLVKVFPSLATRPLHITGESYAGTYIPYILKAYFGLQNPPVKIAKIVIGDGTITSGQVFQLLPALTVIETYPQLIGYDTEVFKYFEDQSKRCGFDVNLTYPQNGIIPTVPLTLPSQRDVPFFLRNTRSHRNFMSALANRYSTAEALSKREQVENKSLLKRDLSQRVNGSIDPWYGCLLLDMFIDYAINYTFPWNLSQNTATFGFDVYNVQDALNPEVNADGSVFLNDNRTRTALHAPKSKDWTQDFNFVFGNPDGNNVDPSPEPMVFLTELAANASAHGVGVVLYSGNNDALIAHRSTEIAIQNTTFGGIQGFTRKPSTPWFNDVGEFAGKVHQERNWTYVLFNLASHLVPASQPGNAFIFLREFVLGSNTTGLVSNSSGIITVSGGENSTLAEDILSGSDEIFYGSGSTQSTYVFPSATRVAWQSFIRTATATPTGSSGALASANTASRNLPWWWGYAMVFCAIALS